MDVEEQLGYANILIYCHDALYHDALWSIGSLPNGKPGLTMDQWLLDDNMSVNWFLFPVSAETTVAVESDRKAKILACGVTVLALHDNHGCHMISIKVTLRNSGSIYHTRLGH